MNSTFSRFCIHRAESPIVAASGCPSTSFSPAPSAAVSRFRASKILRLGLKAPGVIPRGFCFSGSTLSLPRRIGVEPHNPSVSEVVCISDSDVEAQLCAECEAFSAASLQPVVTERIDKMIRAILPYWLEVSILASDEVQIGSHAPRVRQRKTEHGRVAEFSSAFVFTGQADIGWASGCWRWPWRWLTSCGWCRRWGRWCTIALIATASQYTYK